MGFEKHINRGSPPNEQVLEKLRGRFILPGLAGWLHYGKPIPIAGPGRLALTETGIHCVGYKPASMSGVIKQGFLIGLVSVVLSATSIAGFWALFSPDLGFIALLIGNFMLLGVVFILLFFNGYLREFYDSTKEVDFVLPWANVGTIKQANPIDLFESVDGPVIQVENRKTSHKLYFYPKRNAEYFLDRVSELQGMTVRRSEG